ncbi:MULTISPECIES: iron-sulfur cluster biosynthesis family protein [unclassified Breznakia]|uniref:iron-sulfur cluster biosynthesis family protein n=1 Tax=unclassified Breznakia TaxID=2623764 RepID=UPI002476A7D3|nr:MULTISPECIES: iron-sulfur cluster biosynthesis family protein [unclassified Breznakia]MDH6366922.1 uncharacterized protein YqkB [Breznakia sp. PH1-1]MDH6404100.1 uncharacterized protein YqkB [Breznakia sp. PF1-11]MDH6411809.1 uncharacterized protein YqkB [Breznakia sp. PFB1-11]MDH6414088.1 uncharacterized protein YqkB [Breznakia sp. PFB1-14]MDH6416555.1 uncharacterized protein YqkB [Breznakia sp. PFB1-4]
MKIVVDKDAIKRMENEVPMNQDFLLHLDDGQGIDFHEHVSCGLTLHFRLLSVANHTKYPEYEIQAESNIGPIYLKDYSSMYLDTENTIRLGSYGEYQLIGIYSGNIDANLSVSRYD